MAQRDLTFGIDFGTTNSLVSIRGKYGVNNVPIALDPHSTQLCSAVCLGVANGKVGALVRGNDSWVSIKRSLETMMVKD